jgi:hypothetical protein
MKVIKYSDARGIPFAYSFDGDVYVYGFGNFVNELIDENGLENRCVVSFDFQLFLFERFGIRDGSLPKHALDMAILKRNLADLLIP